MRKLTILGLGLAAAFTALGWLVNEQFYVLTAYIACLFAPVMVIGGIYNLMNAKGRKPWPTERKDHSWPADLNPHRRHDHIDPMW